MNLSLIIPNYNGASLMSKNLPKVLDAIKEYKKGNVEIIISDDFSSDNSRVIIDEAVSAYTKNNIICKSVYNNNKNFRGFSKNVMRAASISSGEILILLNTDVSPHVNFLEPLLSHFADPQTFAVGCMDESFENGKSVLRGRGLGSFKRGMLIHKRGEVNASNTLWVSGGSAGFRKSIWNQLGGLDILYNPFYWEDIDLSYRALKSGYKIYFEPKSVVTHTHSEGVIKSTISESTVREISYRNQFIFMWKNITDRNLIISHIFWLPYYFVKSIFAFDVQFLKGFLQAFMRFDKIRKSRSRAQKFFVKKDSEVIQAYV